MRKIVAILLTCSVLLLVVWLVVKPAAPAPVPTNALAKTVATARSPEEAAWQKLTASMEAPPVPSAWKDHEPSKDEVEKFRAMRIGLANKAAENAREFFTRYPSSTNALEARIDEYRMIETAVQLGDVSKLAQLDTLEAALVADKSVDELVRLRLTIAGCQRQANLRREEGAGAILAELEKGVRAVRREFPQRMEGWSLMAELVELYSQQNIAEPAIRLARELQEAPVSSEAKQGILRLVRRFEWLGKPFEFKTSSVAGPELDLAKMRGKVLLIDFWASWCKPCMISLPLLRDTYAELKSRGFEIIGVNLDEQTEAMDRVVKTMGMTWPQHSEPEGMSGPLSSKYGVTGIPSMWLIDQKGVLREIIQGISSDPDRQGDFKKKIEALLNEPAKG